MIMSNETIKQGVDAFRCHGHFGGLHLADLSGTSSAGNTTSEEASKDVLKAASYLTKQARGGWLLPFVTATSTTQALALGKAGHCWRCRP